MFSGEVHWGLGGRHRKEIGRNRMWMDVAPGRRPAEAARALKKKFPRTHRQLHELVFVLLERSYADKKLLVNRE